MRFTYLLAAGFAATVIGYCRSSASVFGMLGCHRFDPDIPEPRTGDRDERVLYQVNRRLWDELLIIKSKNPSKYVDKALELVRECSIRRLDDLSMKDLDQFKTRCKQHFTSDEAEVLKAEFEAQFLIVQALRYMLNSEKPNSKDGLQDFRTRQIRYGLRVHEAIARSMELLPRPLVLSARPSYIAFIVIMLVIAVIIMFALVGAITALAEREPERIQDGLLRLHRFWNRAKVTVFQAEWDKNKVSVSTYPPVKAVQGLTKRSV